jgi:hypothetical protein
MKTMVSTLVVVALAGFSTASQSQTTGNVAQVPSAGKSKTKAANYYPLKAGTKWHYQLDTTDGQKIQLTSQIGGIDNVDGKDLARLEIFANGQKLPQTEHLESRDDGVYRVRMNNVDVTPPICLIKYPLKPGQTWGAETTTGGQKMKVDCSEGKAEEVQVPAGKYQAIPCTFVATAGPAKFTSVFWFAEDVGIVKQKSEIGAQTVTMELTKYEAAK